MHIIDLMLQIWTDSASLEIVSAWVCGQHYRLSWPQYPAVVGASGSPGGHLSIKRSSYQYKDSHYKDKTVWQLSYWDIELVFRCVCWLVTVAVSPGGRLNIKMSSYQYRDPHVKDKTVVILNMGMPIPGKVVFILRWGPGFYLEPMLVAATANNIGLANSSYPGQEVIEPQPVLVKNTQQNDWHVAGNIMTSSWNTRIKYFKHISHKYLFCLTWYHDKTYIFPKFAFSLWFDLKYRCQDNKSGQSGILHWITNDNYMLL